MYASVAAFGAISLISWVLLDTFFSEDRRVTKRLRELTAFEAEQVREAEPLLQPFRERVLRPFGTGVLHIASLLEPTDYRQRLKARLRAAGYPRGVDADRFLIAKTILTVALTGLAATVWAFKGLTFSRGVLLMLSFGSLAFFAPDLWVHLSVSRRKRAIVRALPDVLDMLTISVEAGLGFDQAVAKVVKNGEGPLAEEFGRMLQEVQSGLSRRDALRSLAERVGVPELSVFTSALVQADIFGISISNVLRVQAQEMRVKRRQLAEEQAQKAPVKIVFPLVLCILPATFVVILGPAVIRIGHAFGLF